MKTVLCYGDSNTWGYEPGSGRRYPYSQRWPGVLASLLGSTYHIIEEGLSGRTTVLDDPTRVGKNGLPYLRPCLDTHAPLDLILLMLGTNDLKHRFGLSAYDISAGIAMLLTVIQQSGCGPEGRTPRVLLLSPPHIGPLSALGELFEGALEKSRRLAEMYRIVATQNGCRFLDAAEIVTVSPVDGVHLDAAQHDRLGRRLAEVVRELV